jgi:phosphoribosylamine-glycine ligase
MRFVVATLHFSGLGFALRLQEEGHEVVMAFAGTADRRLEDRYALVGNGFVAKRPLEELMRDRELWRDAYWVWDENHSVEANELLRAEGFQLFGGGRYPDTMEHDRDACLRLVGEHGLQPPPSTRFTSAAEALRLLEAHPDTAYVYKPDHGETHETWLPQSEAGAEANLELRQHLRSLSNEASFVLQERKDGIETNVEVWFVEGEPRFAFMALEAKRKLTGDLGDFVGCAFDFTFIVPIESRAVQESVGRLFPVYREMRYTGFGDANFIVARDGIWFFEKCERFGYNSHPNLLWNLNRSPLGETLVSLVTGTFRPNFAPGFGASVTLYMDHPEPGKAVQYPETLSRSVYPIDLYREGDQLLTCGYYGEALLLACGFGYTIPTAWEAALDVAQQVRFAGRSFRLDGAATDYPASPLRRYEALTAMGYLQG